MSGIGSYLHRESALAASPSTAVGPGGSLAVETLLGYLRSSERFAPIGLFAPWAERTGTAWVPVAPADHDLLLYPLSDDAIAYVNTQSFGHELPWIGILTDKPVDPSVADNAFNRTRYDLKETEGVYRADSGHVVPRIHFLYTAVLHPDVGGGRDKLGDVADRLGGRLVFPLQLPVQTKREAPPLPFPLVLDAQLKKTAMPAPPPPATGADAPPQGLTLGQGLFWAGTTATVGYMLFRTMFPATRRR